MIENSQACYRVSHKIPRKSVILREKVHCTDYFVLPTKAREYVFTSLLVSVSVCDHDN